MFVWAEDQSAKAPPEPGKSAEDLKLPPDTPVHISAKKLQEMRDEIQQLRDEVARLKGPLKRTPSFCKLIGQIDGEVGRLKVQFKFRTYQPRELVVLGCTQGHPTAAELDGQLPFLQPSTDGFVVQVEKAGDHELTLHLEVAVTTKGTDREFDLDLPNAPVTYLDLELADGVQDVRVSGRPPAKPLEWKNNRLTGPLGKAGSLDLTWKSPSAAPSTTPVLESQGQITVRVLEKHIVTDAELTLTVPRGQTAQWRLLVPRGAEVRLLTPEDNIQSASTPDAKGQVTIRLKKPSAEPIKVAVHATQQRPPASASPPAPLPLGPFGVLGASRQQGTIVVRAPAGLGLRYYPRGEPQVLVSQREVTEEERRGEPGAVAAFHYSTWTATEKVPALDLEVDTAQARIEAEVTHTLRLAREDPDGPLFWRVITVIDAKPIRTTGVDQLEIQLPARYHYDEERGPQPAAQVQVDINPTSRIALVRLGQRRLQPFQVTLEGRYETRASVIDEAGVEKDTLDLPRLLKALSRKGEVRLEVPENMQLVAPRQGDPAWQALQPGKQNYKLPSSERLPTQVELAWKAYRPELIVDGEIDVVLTGQQAHVEHRLWFPAGQKPPNRLRIQVPELLTDCFTVTERGELVPAETRDATSRLIVLKELGPKRPLVLRYHFPLPDPEPGSGGRRFTVPLIIPGQGTRGETRVRVWSTPGTVPLLGADSRWEELPLEVAPKHDRLPDLVVRGNRPDLPLTLRLSEPGPALATLVIERALIRVTVDEEGQQNYRASFLVSRLHARPLEMEFPAAVSMLDLKVSFDGLPVNYKVADDARVARLYLARSETNRTREEAGLARKPAVLDVSYHFAPGREGWIDSVKTKLRPPVLRENVGRIPVRWQVGLPSGWVPLYQEGGVAAEQKWTLRGWLLALRPAESGADLERWFFSPVAGGKDEDPLTTDGVARPASLVLSASALQPIQVSHAPQQTWLLVCSLGLIGLGLGLYLLTLPRNVFWPLLAVLGLLVALVGILWPGALAAVLYGCQPGILVLAVVLGVQWVLHQRYRRQIVFMPGFTRRKPGSSLIRSGSSNRPRGEPSTVDEPPPVASAASWAPGGSSETRRAKPPEGN